MGKIDEKQRSLELGTFYAGKRPDAPRAGLESPARGDWLAARTQADLNFLANRQGSCVDYLVKDTRATGSPNTSSSGNQP